MVVKFTKIWKMNLSIRGYLVRFRFFGLKLNIEEFSNFSKNFENNAPKHKDNLDDFLSVFDPSKHDPVLLEESKRDEEVIVSDYLKCGKEGVYKTEAFYCTKLG